MNEGITLYGVLIEVWITANELRNDQRVSRGEKLKDFAKKYTKIAKVVDYVVKGMTHHPIQHKEYSGDYKWYGKWVKTE